MEENGRQKHVQPLYQLQNITCTKCNNTQPVAFQEEVLMEAMASLMDVDEKRSNNNNNSAVRLSLYGYCPTCEFMFPTVVFLQAGKQVKQEK
jgi:hypothetical protein